MLKRILFAVIPMVMLVGTVSADDNLLTKLADMNDNGAVEASIDVDEFGAADVDALLGNDEESDDDAVAACFRRIGYGYGHSYSYRTSYYNHGYSYYNYCRPVYRTYSYHYPVRVYRPVYSYYTPIYTSYWGCY